SAAERGPTLGIKPSEPAPKPLPTAPRPTPVAPSPEPVRSAEELPQRPAAETTDIAQARFTAFLPRQAAVERWHSLLVYAHTPEMLDQIRSDAKRFAAELGGMPREVRDSHAAALKRGTLLTFTPQAEKVTFNPSSVTIAWWEDVHRLEFRFKAEAALANQAVNITITVSADPLIIAQLRGGLVFESPESVYAPSPFENEPVTTAPYRAEEIFVSYSHLDSEVAEACRNAYHALGYEVLMDVDKLRAGEQWNEGLKRLIERATIFQLFWSENSAKSEFCREEWRYALQTPRGRETNGVGFIRPVYWRKPMPTPPEELKHLHFAYVRLPRLNE
ncbi:MAG: toll/interleukin-1 receptor domain-containing protein, partial [Anaerolineae bacterium]|nr:toll/interleukin-1 receptor domain-containing protein [Anaerolineae bacterium]